MAPFLTSSGNSVFICDVTSARKNKHNKTGLCTICIYWVNAYNILGFVYIWYTPTMVVGRVSGLHQRGGGVKWGEFMFTVPVYIME